MVVGGEALVAGKGYGCKEGQYFGRRYMVA